MNIKKTAISISAGAIMLGASILPAFGATESLNWGSEVNAGQCPKGKQVINVTHKVLNDVDSAVGGGVWATDNYNRKVQIWQTGEDTFCAIVSYKGGFVTDDGNSPQGTGTIVEGIKGTMQGGYRATFTGALKPDPAESTHGNLGTFDYDCDVETDPGDHSTCTGLFSWPSTYIDDFGNFSYDWWGWIYHAGNNGTWVNSSGGNSGDIL